MKILFVDVDSLRPDHLGCYGYARNTSPTIDRLAAEGVRFDAVFTSDSPCLPSRTALWSGRSGFRTGVVDHGGTAAQPFVEGPGRGFRDAFFTDGWMRALRAGGHYTATISSFGERHSAWHWYAGFNEVINPGRYGLERADEVVPLAIDWLERHGRRLSDWFLHVNLWDTHTPYRMPEAFARRFSDKSPPMWVDAAILQRFRASFGPHSAADTPGYGGARDPHFPYAPGTVASLDDVAAWIDGYDASLSYADHWIGRLVAALDASDLLADTMIVVSADHGENLGELNIWGDHQTADPITCRVPLIVRPPGGAPSERVDRARHYHFDWAATLIELAGATVPSSWDGVSFAAAFRAGHEAGREFLVTSHGAWCCQRGVNLQYDGHEYTALVTYHDGYKDFSRFMLFDASSDPHELADIASARPDLVDRATRLLATWQADMMALSPSATDPLMTVLREGGPFHCRGELAAYIERLRQTGRAHHAKALANRHPHELDLKIPRCGG
ncbi:MAG: sulfatase-like hydrolase/transferase [Acetobacteraceae bacterium]